PGRDGCGAPGRARDPARARRVSALVVVGARRERRPSTGHRVARKVRMEAVLALEDGTWFRGVAAGADGIATGEVVFNTSMTGYQEVLTDPSYSGQIVTMTCPEIGNYGVASDDVESQAPHVAGFIMREE